MTAWGAFFDAGAATVSLRQRCSLCFNVAYVGFGTHTAEPQLKLSERLSANIHFLPGVKVGGRTEDLVGTTKEGLALLEGPRGLKPTTLEP